MIPADHPACDRCAGGRGERYKTPITMAFQPIADVSTGGVFAHEALVRGRDGRSAGDVLAALEEETLYDFDQVARVTAIETAARIGLEGAISINFMPNAVYNPATCIRRTLKAAERSGFDTGRIIFEITEHEEVTDLGHLREIISEYRRFGFRTAIDDFGAGVSGLGLLAELQPDLIKIDRGLVSGIDGDHVKLAIVEGIVGTAGALGITVIAEGIERPEEAEVIAGAGISLMQGYLFARPRLEGWFRPGEIGYPEGVAVTPSALPAAGAPERERRPEA